MCATDRVQMNVEFTASFHYLYVCNIYVIQLVLSGVPRKPRVKNKAHPRGKIVDLGTVTLYSGANTSPVNWSL